MKRIIVLAVLISMSAIAFADGIQADGRFVVEGRDGVVDVGFLGIGYEYREGFDLKKSTVNKLVIRMRASVKELAHPKDLEYRIKDSKGNTIASGRGNQNDEPTLNAERDYVSFIRLDLNGDVSLPLTVEIVLHTIHRSFTIRNK